MLNNKSTPTPLPSAWQSDPFFQQAVNAKPLSDDVAYLPIKYFDASSLIAFFLVDYDKAQSLIDSPDVKVARIKDNKALFGLAFYNYRELSQGEPYFEVASSLLVYPANCPKPKHPLMEMSLPPDRRNTGLWILDLPVTSKQAYTAGKELWGYPKFITEIEFSLNQKNMFGSVKNPNNASQAILTLQGKLGKGVPAPWGDLVMYSQLDSKLIRATAQTRTLNGAKFATKGDLILTVDSQNTHPMAERLNALGLNGAMPLSVTFTESLQLRLNEGVVFG